MCDLLFSTAIPRGQDNEDAGPPEHREALPGDRDGEDALPGDGVRERWRGLRLPRAPWPHEGEGGACQVPADRLRGTVLPPEKDHTQGSEGGESVAGQRDEHQDRGFRLQQRVHAR